MTSTSAHVNLCVIQPAGYVHALGLLDAALYFKYQFQRLGARVELHKNRLVHGAINLVFGAHLGFDRALLREHNCLIVNLEQLGSRGAPLSADYLDLLQHALVIDYDEANRSAYGAAADDVPLVQFGHAPYLPRAACSAQDLAQRPIDLLFFGSINPRRQALFDRIEATGRKVSTLNTAVYGPERDAIVAQAKAVLNVHFYESARFEQVRAFQVLSLGTPLVSERSPATQPSVAFDTCGLWFNQDTLTDFFAHEFLSPLYFDVAARALDVFQEADPIEAYADTLAFAVGVHKVRCTSRSAETRLVRRLHIGSGKDYRPGWLNIDIQASTLPDAVLDLGQAHTWPVPIDSPLAGAMTLAAGEVEHIHANNVLEHVPDLSTMMSNCLALLKTGGRMTIEVPHERAPGAWQDPTHVRAMNDNSWRYYTDWFWYLGWFEHRFEKTRFTYLDHRLQPCEREAAWFMRVELTKIETSIAERMQARCQRADFGSGYALLDGEQMQGFVAAATPPSAPPSPPAATASPAAPRGPLRTVLHL